MDGRLIRTNCDETGDYVVPYVLSPRDLVSRPDNMDETVLSSSQVVVLFKTKAVSNWLSKNSMVILYLCSTCVALAVFRVMQVI